LFYTKKRLLEYLVAIFNTFVLKTILAKIGELLADKIFHILTASSHAFKGKFSIDNIAQLSFLACSLEVLHHRNLPL